MEDILLKEKRRRVQHQYAMERMRKLHKTLYDEWNLLCISQHDTTKIMDEVHTKVCRPHTNGMTLSKKTLSFDY